MKNFILAFLLALMMPLSAFAISLDDLQNNPNSYVKVCENVTSTYYLEQGSIKVLRDSFPYLTLQAKIYLVMYEQSAIAVDLYTISYDCNRSLFALVVSKRIESPNMPTDKLTDYAIAEARKDSGIAVNIEANHYYHLDGTTIISRPMHVFGDKAKFETLLYSVANNVFYQHNQCKAYFFPGM